MEHIMIDDVVVEPMTEQFVLWRCLHSGPLSRDTIDQWPADNPLPWDRYSKRNFPILLKLTRTYGACAIIARDGDRIVGQLRFYPKVVWDMERAGELCLQQDFPSGPADDFAATELPSLAQIEDKTLAARYPHPHLQEPGDFVRKLEAQAKSLGISPARAKDQLVMRLKLA